jgi:hypothetical protein
MPITTRPWSFRYKESSSLQGWPWSNNDEISKLPPFWNTGYLAAAALLAGVLTGYIAQGVALIETVGSTAAMASWRFRRFGH